MKLSLLLLNISLKSLFFIKIVNLLVGEVGKLSIFIKMNNNILQVIVY